MRAIGSPFPDPIHLLASLCEASLCEPSRREALQSTHPIGTVVPFVAAAVGSHPIEWHELSWRPSPDRFQAPVDAWAIGVIGGGTTSTGDDVLVAFVVDVTGRQRAVVVRDGTFIETADPAGALVEDCRTALGLHRAA